MDLEGKKIVLIVLDSLTAFRLPMYGCEKNTAPFLSKLSENNTIGNFVYSASTWSVPSHASIFTGKLPSEHKCTSKTMKLDEKTLASKMKDKNYETASITTNYFINKEIGFHQGFDFFTNHQAEISAPKSLKDSKALQKTQKNSERNQLSRYFIFGFTALANREFNALKYGFKYLINGKRWHSNDHGAKGINKLIKKFTNRSEKFFVFANYMEIHTPKTVSKKEGIDGYDEAITYLDKRIEELYESIIEEHPDTVFIITSDHGESHGFYEYKGHKLKGHQYAITERNIRVPLIIAGKDINQRELDENISLTELHDLILGEKEITQLGTKNIYSEYHGAADFLKKNDKSFSNIILQLKHANVKKIGKMGLKYLTDSKGIKDLHLNKSFAEISGNIGYILNTHLPDREFISMKKSFREQNEGSNEEIRNRLKEKYREYIGNI